MKGKRSGWHGESRRHSLARKGVNTANGFLRDFKEKRQRQKEKQRMIEEGTFDVFSSKWNLDECVRHYEDEGFLVFYEKLWDEDLYRVFGVNLDKIDLSTYYGWLDESRRKLAETHIRSLGA